MVPVWITAKSASQMTGLSPRMLSKMADAGRFRVLRVGDGWRRYSLDEIEEFVRENASTKEEVIPKAIKAIWGIIGNLPNKEIDDLGIGHYLDDIEDAVNAIEVTYRRSKTQT